MIAREASRGFGLGSSHGERIEDLVHLLGILRRARPHQHPVPHGLPADLSRLDHQLNKKAWYFNQGDNVELDADNNGNIDVPNLFGGFDRDKAPIQLPANSFNQQNAALGLSPQDGTQPSNTTIRQQLGLASSTSPPPAGIDLPNSGGSVIGGIYVHGNLDQCTVGIDGSGRQVYTIRQGASTQTITVDRAANKTYFHDGTTTTPYDGLPRGILYTKGSLSGLGGPGRNQDGIPNPALADATQLLIAATGDIVLQNDMVYNDFAHGESILGLYSDDGSVRVGSQAPDDMLLDAFVMAAGNLGSFTVDGYNDGDPRGTFHLRGGMVSDRYGAFYTFNASGTLKTGYARDFHYDRRGLIPPYYPTTSIFVPNAPAARTLVWKEL